MSSTTKLTYLQICTNFVLMAQMSDVQWASKSAGFVWKYVCALLYCGVLLS